MQTELDKAIACRTIGPSKDILAKDLPTEHRVHFSLYTRYALMTVEGTAEFDGEHLWVRSKSFANSIMLDADAEIEVWELCYDLDGERKVKLMVSHVAKERFLDA